MFGSTRPGQRGAAGQLPAPLGRRSKHWPRRDNSADGERRRPGREAAARPTVEVVVAFDKSELTDAARRDLRPGISARAEIDCGRRSLGYVWLHDLWDTTLTWLRF